MDLVDILQGLTIKEQTIVVAVVVIIIYAGFRYFIHCANKAYKNSTPIQQKGNYWERLRKRTQAQAS
jgi:hypothetical protein